MAGPSSGSNYISGSLEAVLKAENNSLAAQEALKNKLGVKVFPSEANFIIANFGESCNKVYEQLKEKRILVRNRTKYPLLKNCLRIGIGTREQCRQLINEIKNILNKNIPNPKKKAILFDMDGVLIDVKDSYRMAIKQTAEFFTNTTVTMEDIQQIKNQGNANNDWDVTCKVIKSRGFTANRPEVIKKFQELYLGKYGKAGLRTKEKWLLNKAVLKKLSEEYALGIVTGRPREEEEFALRFFSVERFFECLVALGDYPEKKAKPDPYPIKIAMKKMQSEKAVYIGDTVDDINSAKAAGLDTIGVIPPCVNPEPLQSLLKQAGAKIVINDINKLSEVL